MKIVPDLSGEVFGELLILRKATPEECIEYGKAEKQSRKCTFYWWKCSCGNIGISNRQDLISGRAKSCGCFKRRQAEQEADKMIGKRFGNLVVESYEIKARNNNPKKREIYYTCKCDCGGIVVTTRRMLENGRTKSCGCITKEKL